MRAIVCLLISALIIAPAGAKAAASYAGIWNFNMKVAQTTCTAEGSPAVGASKTLSIQMTQNKKVLSGTVYTDPPITGSSTNYTGYLTKGGIIMALASSCPVVPSPVCSKDTESFTFENASKKSAKVMWLSITRNDNSEFVCSTVYSGTAKKAGKKSKD